MYSKRWLSLIDRGGLFHVNNQVYVFFHSIEFEVRRHLKQLPLEKGSTKKYVMDEILNDVDVQYHWSSIASDIDEKAAQMLLRDTVELWLSIRGFSEVGAFLEEYKKVKDKATKKTVGLRKGRNYAWMMILMGLKF